MLSMRYEEGYACQICGGEGCMDCDWTCVTHCEGPPPCGISDQLPLCHCVATWRFDEVDVYTCDRHREQWREFLQAPEVSR